MKQLINILLFIIPYLSYGQFPEVQEQQDRVILFNNVKTIKVYTYDYQGNSVDSTFSIFEKYNQKGQLIERRDYFGEDTSSYEGVLYFYDTLDYSTIKKPFVVNPPSIRDPYYQGHPKKRIEKANEKKQLITVEEYHEEVILKKIYIYGTNDLLEQIDIYVDKKLFWVYKIYYDFY